MKPRLGLPDLGLGLGLRGVHLPHILEHQPSLGFFEIISENYMAVAPHVLARLERVRAHYPVVMHGVSLSIGSPDPLRSNYLTELKRLADHLDVPWVSDHLCWTGILGKNSHDLLPLPYTEESLRLVTQRARQVMDFLERPLLLENPSSYLSFKGSTMTEVEFLARVAEDADCGLLLDVNNVYVSAFNHGFDPETYLATIPVARVVQVHLAGHTNKGTHLLDTHSDHVADPVWLLYQKLVHQTGSVSTMVEWDANIPKFEVVYAEVQRAAQYRAPGAVCAA